MRVALALLVAFLAGCTSYGPYSGGWFPSFKSGYSDEVLSPRIYRVVFRGNQWSAAREVEDFALLRSADLTLEEGYRYFVILKGEDLTIPNDGVPFAYAQTIAVFWEKPAGDGMQVEGVHAGRFAAAKPRMFLHDADSVQRALRRGYALDSPGH